MNKTQESQHLSSVSWWVIGMTLEHCSLCTHIVTQSLPQSLWTCLLEHRHAEQGGDVLLCVGACEEKENLDGSPD